MKLRIVNKKKFVKAIGTIILTIAALITIGWMTVEFIQYPEAHLTTWRYQLKLDIERGDQEAIEYYQKNYWDKGRKLWD